MVQVVFFQHYLSRRTDLKIKHSRRCMVKQLCRLTTRTFFIYLNVFLILAGLSQNQNGEGSSSNSININNSKAPPPPAPRRPSAPSSPTPKAGLEKTRFFFLKTQPSGFICFFVYWGFVWVFWFFIYLPRRESF
jgi:hypothetical protein